MECPNTYQPKTDESGVIWKKVQIACFDTFSNVRWHAGKSHLYFPACKSHTFQVVLRGALAEGEGKYQFTNIMKRGLVTKHGALYTFSTDHAFKYQLTPKERDFLKKLNLEYFITSNYWGVLHPHLVSKAIATFESNICLTTVKGKSVLVIANYWRELFQRTFHLIKNKLQPVTMKWELT